ncbi:MAG: hypothetical protein WDO74_07930 [Pseudomonadota bacterium]
MTPEDLRDIQGLILSGYGKKPAARYAIFQIVNADAARAWLGRVAQWHPVRFVSWHASA